MKLNFWKQPQQIQDLFFSEKSETNKQQDSWTSNPDENENDNQMLVSLDHQMKYLK